jgi:hypothetical protein
MTTDFLKQIGISSLGVRSAILDIYKNERSMFGHTCDDKSPPSDKKKSYADTVTVIIIINFVHYHYYQYRHHHLSPSSSTIFIIITISITIITYHHHHQLFS